jgi:sortase B
VKLGGYYYDLHKRAKMDKDIVSIIDSFSPPPGMGLYQPWDSGGKGYGKDGASDRYTPPDREPRITRQILDFRELYGNEDVIGFIRMTVRDEERKIDTGIKYPIVQGVDNKQYLYHSEDGKWNWAGSIFMHSRNDPLLTDQNTVLFGHNMRDVSMFGPLRYYTDAEFALMNENYIIEVTTIYEHTVWHVFAGYYTNVAFNYLVPNYDTREGFEGFINEIKRRVGLSATVRGLGRGFFIEDMNITADDLILTLSTCVTWNDSRLRHVVQARLIERRLLY